MSLIIDATKAAERERERRAEEGGGASGGAPLLIPLRSTPQPEFSWHRAAMLGVGGAALLAVGWIAFVKITDTRRQPLALVSPPPIADVVAAGTPADTAATPSGDSSIAAEPQAIAQSRPASSVATPPRRVASAGAAPVATAGRDSAGAPRDSAAGDERPRADGQLRIAVDAREMNLSQIFAMAVAAHRAGDLSQAATGYERVLAVDGNHVDALNNMGVLLSAMRNFDRAELLLRRAVRLSPRNAGAWNNLGTALAQRGQTADAIAAYQQALSIEPQHVTARVSLAQQYLAIGSRVESRQLLEAVLSSNPAMPEAYYALGQVHELEQDWPAAISAYNAFIRLAPGRLQEHVASVRRRVDALSARVR